MANLTPAQLQKLSYYRDFWRRQVVSTEPVDRPAAEDAIRCLYRTLDEPEPEFLWFDAPRDAGGAAQALLIEQDPEFFERYWGNFQLNQRVEWKRIRGLIANQVELAGWEETRHRLVPPPVPEKADCRIGFAFLPRALYQQGAAPWLPFGKRYFHFMSAVEDTSPCTKEDRRREVQEYERIRNVQRETDPIRMLQEDVDEVEWTCFYSSPAFKTVYEQQALVESRLQYPDPGFELRRISFGQLARLEFLARECAEAFPASFLALLDVAKQVGLWWALDRVAIICDRPRQLLRNAAGQLHNSEGPAMVYRDGWKVYAVNGARVDPVAVLPPEQITFDLIEANKPFKKILEARYGKARYRVEAAEHRRAKPAPVLRKQLPTDPTERLEFLRDAGSGKLPFYERYQGGDRVNVWNELVALGDRVRLGGHAADGLAVAYATMDRAVHNASRLVERLNRLHYEFSNAAWEKPSPESRKEWRDVDKRIGTVPFSLRAWWDVAGSVDFTGDHDLLSNRGGIVSTNLGTLLTDPLVIYGPAATVSEDQMFEGEPDYEPECVLAPDRYHKHEISGGQPYSISVPCPAADAVILYEGNELYLVDYLRRCFRYGGFPGFFDDESRIPEAEMAILTDDLLEI